MASVLRAPFWVPRPADEAYWSGAPIDSPIISFLTQQKLFGQGGQVPPYRPDRTYDDAPVWNGSPIDAAPLQFLTAQKVFGQGGQVWTKRWSQSYTFDDPPVWSGSPIDAAPIQILTAVRFFGAGGQAPAKLWRWDFDVDASPWVQTTERNLVLINTPIGSPKNIYRWWFDTDWSAYWQGSPISYNESLHQTPGPPIQIGNAEWLMIARRRHTR